MANEIIARAGGVTRSVKAKRPSWADMKKYYPPDGVTKYDFYPKISKQLGMQANESYYTNTCAFRMSYALNKSGVNLPIAPSTIGADGKKYPGSIKGDDGKNYWFRVKNLSSKLTALFASNSAPDYEKTFILPAFKCNAWSTAELQARASYVQNNYLSKIENKNGIIVFKVNGWGDASGHFTLWDSDSQKLLYVGENQEENSRTSPHYYFWMVPFNGSSGCTYSITFWELK